MAEEKHHAGGPNWLLGLDKLTSPTFDFLGIKLRDRLRSWLYQKARERALLHRFEKGFLYRHVDLLNYGDDQYAAMLANVTGVMLERQYENIVPLVHFAVAEFKIPPERAFECVLKGFERSPITLTGGERILYSAAAGVLDILILIQAAQMLFQWVHIPSAFHLENPGASDEAIENLMQDAATLKAVSDAMEPAGAEVTKWFAKTLCEAYGQPFDEKAFDAGVAATNHQLPQDTNEGET